MQTQPLAISDLRRPRMLVRAARLGLADYNRRRDLRRLTGNRTTPTPEQALSVLLEQEERLESIRKSGDATYSIARHVELLIAVMAELRLLPRAAAQTRAQG